MTSPQQSTHQAFMKLFCIILSTESGIFLQTGGLQKLADIIQVCCIIMLGKKN